MVTLKKAKELYGELPKDVIEDPYYQKEFLILVDEEVKTHGEEWVKEHRVMLLSQWEYVRTLV
jgi:hypothetical protein